MTTAALVLAALLSAGACGSSGSGVSSAAGAQLQLLVAAIRASAAQGDRSAAESQLQQLRVDVVQFRAANKVNDAAAARILKAAGEVDTNLSLLAPASTAPTTTAPTTTATTTTETTTTETTTTTSTPSEPSSTGKGKHGGQSDHGD